MGAGTIIEHRGGKDTTSAILFFLLTAYLFLGIAIASDIFMNAIEKICSATRQIVETREDENGVIITTTRSVLIWNETVANLTLMALGSAAPEIMLSTIEVCLGLGSQESGSLGPGAIVGSAAFNLFVISGICICCIKGEETRRIKMYPVFLVTCVSCLFAYSWMILVLTWLTPDQVNLWEALFTLACCPILVIIAYWVDRKGSRKKSKSKQSRPPYQQPQESVSNVASEISKDSRGELYQYSGMGEEVVDEEEEEDTDRLFDESGKVRRDVLERMYNQLMDMATLTPEEVTTILVTKLSQAKPRTRAWTWHRAKAVKIFMGGSYSEEVPELNERLQEVVDALEKQRNLKPEATSASVNKMAVVEFQASALAVPAQIGSVTVTINRSGKEDIGFSVHVESEDGSARAGTHYRKVSETIYFDPYVTQQTVEVPVLHEVKSGHSGPHPYFYLHLRVSPEHHEQVMLGQMRTIDIILEEDEKKRRGRDTITFSKGGYRFRDGMKLQYLEVERTDGYDHEKTVSWKIIPSENCRIIPAGTQGKVEFAPGEKLKMIEIPLLSHRGGDIKQTFEVELYDPKNGSTLGSFPVTISALPSTDNEAEGFKLEVWQAVTATITKYEKTEEDLTWDDQFKRSLLPNDGNYKEAKCSQWFMHVLVFPFKVLLAILIPPPHLGKGWPSFFLALFAIGLLTKFVGDSAGAFGDSCGLPPVITSITVVVLGTSLPQLLASVIAARTDKTADKAIANVTGSNSVNVFLGMGFPWTIAAIYYAIVDQKDKNGKSRGTEPFCVQQGTLAFNGIEFSVLAFFALCILTFRRHSKLCGKAELGGPAPWKWITAIAMITLWFLYVGLAILPFYNQEVALQFSESVNSTCDLIEVNRRLEKPSPND